MKFTLRLTFTFALLAAGKLLLAQNIFPLPSGNVGIGTTTPIYPLQVVSTTSGLAQFKTSSTANTAISILNGTGQMNIGVGATTPHSYIWSNTGSFFIGNDGGPTLFVKGMGGGATSSVGINTMTPGYNFDVNGVMHSNNQLLVDQLGANNAGVWVRGNPTGDASMILQGGAGNWQAYWFSADNGVLRIGGNGGVEPTLGAFNIDYLGNTAIGGNTASNYKLDVYGNLRANLVVVNTTGADFVFDTTYRLSPLPELERYIHANHHLPEVAPAKQMQEQGLDLGDNQTRLLQKVEELTLYIIDQDKKMAKMQSEIDLLKTRSQK